LPSAPTGLTITSKTGSTVSLSWTAGDNGGQPVADYVIQYSTDGTNWTTFNDGTSTNTTTTVTGLARSTNYQFRVAQTTIEGTSTYSATANTTPGTAPNPPENLLNFSKTATSLTFYWSAPTDNGGQPVTDYIIEYSVNGTNSWTTVNDGISTTGSTTITGLTRGTSYRVRVSAINIEGTGTPITSGTAVPAVAPSAPTALTVTSKTGTTVSLSWTAGDNGGQPVTDYVIQYSTDGTNWTTFDDGPSTNTTTTVTGLTRSTSYQFQVSQTTIEGTSTNSATANATPATIPAPPTDITLVSKTATSLTLSWYAGDNGGRPVTD
jgi:titin